MIPPVSYLLQGDLFQCTFFTFLQSSDNASGWVEIGRTEKIKDSLDPRWQTKFLLDYKFEERQIFRFAIYDIDSDSRLKLDDHDSLGHIDCSLGEVSGNH